MGVEKVQSFLRVFAVGPASEAAPVWTDECKMLSKTCENTLAKCIRLYSNSARTEGKRSHELILVRRITRIKWVSMIEQRCFGLNRCDKRWTEKDLSSMEKC